MLTGTIGTVRFCNFAVLSLVRSLARPLAHSLAGLAEVTDHCIF